MLQLQRPNLAASRLHGAKDALGGLRICVHVDLANLLEAERISVDTLGRLERHTQCVEVVFRDRAEDGYLVGSNVFVH